MLKNFTRQLFAQLSRHLPHRLIQRDPLPDARNLASAPIPDSLGKRCLDVAAMDEQEIWRAFDSHPEGLNDVEVAAKIALHGDNQIPAQKPSPWWVHLWTCYRNPFNLLLTVLGIVSYSTEDLFAAGVIALMVGISTLLNFIQEARSTKAADALKAMVSNTATVLRVINEQGESRWLELPIDQLVPGDIVRLSAGDMIPADLRIIVARDLFVAQASLTGESLPVEKVARTRDPLQTNPLECDTLCFMGTNVGERLGAGYRLRHRRQHLVRPACRARQRAGKRAERLPERHQPGQHAADPLYAGDGAGGAADQRLHQRRLVGSGAVRAVGGGRPDAGDVADDRHLDAGARGGEAVKTKSDRQTPRRHSKLWRDGYPLHR
ncbi:Magnesium transporting ATPase, P-type 1 [Klebsiella aerogenes]|nr:Magnesium transporting ATPase, P-type 1 [Klebsiella aerogenes]